MYKIRVECKFYKNIITLFKSYYIVTFSVIMTEHDAILINFNNKLNIDN